jgi:hypothetical protein
VREIEVGGDLGALDRKSAGSIESGSSELLTVDLEETTKIISCAT